MDLESGFMGKFGHAPVVVLRDQPPESSPPVHQKPIRLIRRAENPPEQSRQPFAHFIAINLLEIHLHLRRPGLTETFPAINKHTAHLALQWPFVQPPHITVEACLYSGRVELVAFPPCRFRRCRGIDSFGVDVSKPHHSPSATFRRLPFGQPRQIDDARTVDKAYRLLHRGAAERKRTQRPAALGFPVRQPRSRTQPRFAISTHRQVVFDTEPPDFPHPLTA